MRTSTRTSKVARLSDIALNEISFVGKGDNKGAHILLLKGHPNPIVALGKEYKGKDKKDVLVKWLEEDKSKADGIFKDEEVAEMFADLLQDKTIRDQIWSMVWMLEDSICSIMCDETGTNKGDLIQTTVDQFKTAVMALTKSKGGKKGMDPKELLEKLQKEFDELKGKYDTLTKTVEELTKEKEELVKQIPKAESVIKMEDLPEPVRKQMEENAVTIKKQADDIAKIQEEGLITECIAKAAELPSISAEGVVVADVLKEVKKVSKEVFDKICLLLKAADARIKEGGLFTEVGKSGGSTGATAYDQIVAKAAELRKTMTELTKEQAFDRVYKSDDDLRAAYIAETRSVK
jgi:hypothetical protein